MNTPNRALPNPASRGDERITLPRLLRQHRRRITIVCAVVLGVSGLWFAGNALIRLPWRVVSDVSVVGTRHVSTERIRDLANVPLGAPLFGVNVDSVVTRVESIPWIARATVKRRLSGTFEIRVVERRSIGMFWSDGFHLVDTNGYTAILEVGSPPDVPIITGLSDVDTLRNAGIRDVVPVLRVIDELEPLRTVVSEISYSDLNHMILLMAPGTVPVWLPRHADRNRFVMIASLVAHYPQMLRSARYVDARFVGHVAVKS